MIEDAAEVHGALYKSNRGTDKEVWKKCGGIGHISTFSFFANKLITTGEGGMVVTNDAGLAERSRNLRNLCFRADRRFLHTELGHQFRFTNIQAAIGLSQVNRIEQIVERKRWIASEYLSRLQHLSQLQFPHEHEWARNVYWVFALVLHDSVRFDAKQFADKLKSAGVETRPFFLGMHSQPALQELYSFEGKRYPVCDRIADRGLYIPSGLAITLDQIEKVCEAVIEILS